MLVSVLLESCENLGYEHSSNHVHSVGIYGEISMGEKCFKTGLKNFNKVIVWNERFDFDEELLEDLEDPAVEITFFEVFISESGVNVECIASGYCSLNLDEAEEKKEFVVHVSPLLIQKVNFTVQHLKSNEQIISLFKSLRGGDFEYFKKILSENNFSASDLLQKYDGKTLIHVACEMNNSNILKIILQTIKSKIGENTNIDANIPDEQGVCPLSYVCRRGNMECASQMIQSNLFPQNYGKHYEKNMFLSLCDYKFSEFEKIVHAQEISIEDVKSPVFLCCIYNHPDIMELLIREEPENNYELRKVECLCIACYTGSEKCVQKLLSMDVSINQPLIEGIPKSSALYFACIRGHAKIASKLISHDAIIKLENTEMLTHSTLPANFVHTCYPLLLLLFSKSSDARAVAELYKSIYRYRMTPEQRSIFVMLSAAHRPDIFTSVILEDKSSITPNYYDQFMDIHFFNYVARYCTVGVIHELMAYDADLALKNSTGRTVLHEVCEYNNSDVLKELVDSGKCLIDAEDSNGFTPFRVAIEHANSYCALQLLELRSKETKKKEKHLDLHVAALFGKRKLAISVLKTKNLDVNGMILKNGTPLHYCCYRVDGRLGREKVQKRQQTIVSGLLQLGARLDLKSQKGDFAEPLTVAVQNDRDDIALLLLQKEASCIETIKEIMKSEDERLKRWLLIFSKEQTVDIQRSDELNRNICHYASLYKSKTFFTTTLQDLLGRNIVIPAGADKYGQTPLHLLALSPVSTPYYLDEDYAEVLIQLNVDCFAVDELGHTATFYALMSRRFGVVESLVAKFDADRIFNTKNVNGLTVLEELLESSRGVDPKSENILIEICGHCHFEFDHTHYDILSYLHQYKLNIRLKDERNLSLMAIALSEPTSIESFLQLGGFLFQDEEEFHSWVHKLDSQENSIFHEISSREGSSFSKIILKELEKFGFFEKHLLSKNNMGTTVLGYYLRKFNARRKETAVIMIEKVLDKIDAKEQDIDGNTLLHDASWSGDVDIIKKIFSLNPDLNIRNNQGDTPFDIFLKAFGEEKNHRKEFIQVCELFLSNEIALTAQSYGRIPNEILVKYQENWDLSTNIISKNFDRVERLINSGASAEISSCTDSSKKPLFIAVDIGNFDMFRLLISKGKADTDICLGDESQRPLLHYCCQKGAFDMIKYLIENVDRIDIKQTDINGYTALQHVFLARPEENLPEIVHFLVQNGADVNVKDASNRNVIHLFCLKNNMKNVDSIGNILANHDKLLKEVDINGMTPFHLAAQSNNPNLLKLLLKYKHAFDIYSKDKDKNYAINYLTLEECKQVLCDGYIQGYLYKKGAKGVIKLYRKRYFVMKEDIILYFSNHSMVEETGNIDVENISHIRNCGLNFQFEIHMKPGYSRVYELQAESQQEYLMWLQALGQRFTII